MSLTYDIPMSSPVGSAAAVSRHIHRNRIPPRKRPDHLRSYRAAREPEPVGSRRDDEVRADALALDHDEVHRHRDHCNSVSMYIDNGAFSNHISLMQLTGQYVHTCRLRTNVTYS